MLSAVIIDDEKSARVLLEKMLELYCPTIKVIGQAEGVASGVEAIRTLEPDVVFLDIQMLDGTGFDLLKEFSYINFKYIFVTAYQEYAVKAFKFSAIDYILKPVDSTDLINAVEKLNKSVLSDDVNKRFGAFIENIQWHEDDPQKIVLKTAESVVVAEKDSIVRCESINNCTMFYFTDRPKVMVSRTLKEFDDLLAGSGFVRIHQSHLVNLAFVEKYKRYPESHVILTDGETLPVAVRRRELLQNWQKQKEG